MSRVSIVIPALNEATNLGRTLRLLKALDPPAHEILVVDGGSADGTAAVARAFGLRVLESPRGRAVQMNLGGEAATGDILCFLHADTLVPDDCVEVMMRTLADPGTACAGFVSLMAGPETTRWGISLHNYLKTYYAPLLFRPRLFFKGLRLLFGDQVIFCRRSQFLECGGFDPKMVILEEADLCLKMVRFGRIRQINRVVHSSDRRVVRWGSFKATAVYMYIGFLWGLGASPAYLKRFYADIR
ncbi:TIGR04283 family arsenosugar biosynthesis glycosyltransferase [Gloeobacter violaceus]|uniref:4,4'-diaponeurosporenoate glycosyltransferase n=1 Tax=Gloeobacter violaceus (strain ATCC 29082 / PCC 7421) TaxID=251221 RepID=Q7NMU7_GLOVI|nr:TIGR04283 family arsenosugar biosynthesis glycosyltransferase [Gloeobacter violaceus]BAC88609.1 glr0668 [Gloeobacter violaceus PCC 7421]